MEGWQQRRLGETKKEKIMVTKKLLLGTGLLMEGVMRKSKEN